MAVTPNSIITPQVPARSAHVAQAFVANADYGTAPANVVLLVTAGPNGGRLTRLRALPTATVAATQLQEFRSTDAGVTKRFTQGTLANAYTMAGTTQTPPSDFGYSDGNPMLLAPNERVYVGVGVSGSWCFEAEWADY